VKMVFEFFASQPGLRTLLETIYCSRLVLKNKTQFDILFAREPGSSRRHVQDTVERIKREEGRVARLLTEDWVSLTAKLIVETRILEGNIGREIFEANGYEIFRTADESVLPILYSSYKPKLQDFTLFLAYFFEYIIKEGEKLSKGKEVDFEKLYEFYNLNFEMNKKVVQIGFVHQN
jgi:hypothetical protein